MQQQLKMQKKIANENLNAEKMNANVAELKLKQENLQKELQNLQ